MSRKALDRTLGLLKALEGAPTPEDVAQLLLSKLRGFGVEAIIASLLPSPAGLARFDRRLCVMVKVPEEWQRRYLAQGYAAKDPIVWETLRRSTGFHWRDAADASRRNAKGGRIMGEAAEFGLADGFTVPITTIEGVQGGVTFAGRRLDLAPEQWGVLTFVASYAFGHALIIRDRAREQVATLSPREQEALQWAAFGKTDWEIGKIMKISTHGVDSHLRKVRMKLCAKNRTQAVAEGIRYGLIQ